MSTPVISTWLQPAHCTLDTRLSPRENLDIFFTLMPPTDLCTFASNTSVCVYVLSLSLFHPPSSFSIPTPPHIYTFSHPSCLNIILPSSTKGIRSTN